MILTRQCCIINFMLSILYFHFAIFLYTHFIPSIIMMLCSIDASRTTLKATTCALQGQRKYMGAEKPYKYVEK